MSDSKIHSSSLILASFLHSALHFLSKADAFNIFPYKVKPLMAHIMHMLDSTGSNIDRTLGFLIANNEKKYDIPQSISGRDLKKLSFFMFLYGINTSLPEDVALPNITQQPPHESLEILLLNAASKLNNLK